MSKQKHYCLNFAFLSFQGSEEWQEKKLSKACEVNPSAETLPNKFVYIDLESVEDGKLLQKKMISLENAPSRAQRLLRKGDVIFQWLDPIKKIIIFLG